MRKFERNFNFMFFAILTINLLIAIAVLGGIGWAGFAIMKYFGIVG